MASIEVGDYVGVIENEWIAKNRWIAEEEWDRNLFGYSGPKPIGVVIKLSLTKHMAIVMNEDGNLQSFKVERLEVMN